MSAERIRKRRRRRSRDERRAHLEGELARGAAELSTITTANAGFANRLLGLFRTRRNRTIASGVVALAMISSMAALCVPI